VEDHRQGQRPTHPHTCQLDRHLITSTGGGEPAAQVHVLADLQEVGAQGGGGVIAHVRPDAVEGDTDVGRDQAYRPCGRCMAARRACHNARYLQVPRGGLALARALGLREWIEPPVTLRDATYRTGRTERTITRCRKLLREADGQSI
jgi:hypothetical protein